MGLHRWFTEGVRRRKWRKIRDESIVKKTQRMRVSGVQISGRKKRMHKKPLRRECGQ